MIDALATKPPLSPKDLAEIISKHYIPTSERVIQYSIEIGELPSTRLRPRGKHKISREAVPAFLKLNQVPPEATKAILQALAE
jgi:hypothetical protein